MIDKIKSMILKLCEGQDWDWKSHIESVVEYSKQLAKELGADEEICEISAWLHDIKKLKGERNKHHVRGSEEAVDLLRDFGYPEEKIEKVKHCILTHSTDKTYPPESIEAKIVASADALSHYDNFLALTYVAYNLKKQFIEEGREWLIKKYNSCWDKLIPEARKIAKPKHDVIMLILSQ